ncbi:DUF2790 domain-containing protein [Pseudomonas gingeri]
MKLKAFIATGLFCALSVLAVIAPVQAASQSASAKPDIQRVLSVVTDATGGCGVVNAHMTYLDSHGEQHSLDYGKFANNCNLGS